MIYLPGYKFNKYKFKTHIYQATVFVIVILRMLITILENTT